MSIQINSATFLDERYSAKIVETLRSNTFLIPGVTYNSNYDGEAAGAISVSFHAPNVESVSSAAVGGDYTASEVDDELVTVNICNAFRKQKKLRNIAAASVSYDYAQTSLNEAAEDVREGRDRSAIAALVNGGTAATLAEAKTWTGDSDLAALPALTKTNVKSITLGVITKLKKAKAKPSIILASPEWEAAIVDAQTSGSGPFTPETNEEMIKAGSVGRYLGCSVIPNQELNGSANTAVALNTAIGTAVSGGVDLSKTDFVIYDARFFGFLNHVTDGRIVDSQTFAGSYACIEDNCGMKVLKSGTVVVYQHA